MPEFISFGETMAVMIPEEIGPIRYSPEFRLRAAGAESNTAIGVHRLGHSAGWISALGKDGLGDYVLSQMRGEGIDVSGVKMDGKHRTGLLLKEFSRGETTVYYYRENSAASHFGAEDLPYEYLRSAKILHVSGITPILSESCREATLKFVEFAKKEGKLLSFDPNIRYKLWKGTDYGELLRSILFSSQIALLGLEEAKVLLKEDDPVEIVKILREKGVQYIGIKNGGEGAWCADGTDFVRVPPERCNPLDPVGAGDGFNAGFISGILKNRDLALCGRMGAIVGAMATETKGDADGYPTEEQLEARLENRERVYR